MEEIARAARRKEEQDREAARKQEPAPGSDQRAAEDLLRQSLAGHTEMTLFEGLAAGVALVTPIVLVLTVTPWRLDDPVVLVPTVFACAGSIFAQMSLTERVLSSVRTARLFSLGHGFDAAPFLRELSVRRRSPQLVVALEFERPWTDADQRTTVTAMGQWVREVQAAWKDPQRLVISTAKLKGTGTIHGKGKALTIFTNRAVYDCFDQVVGKALPVLHRANPVVKLSATVSGDVSPYDEPARRF
jgi:hypothetical protein